MCVVKYSGVYIMMLPVAFIVIIGTIITVGIIVAVVLGVNAKDKNKKPSEKENKEVKKDYFDL